MGNGSGMGLIRVGNNGGKVIMFYNGTPSTLPYASTPGMQEAKGLKDWTFGITDSTGTGAFAATVQIQGTIDAATAAGTAQIWFVIGSDMSQDNSFMNFKGYLCAVRAVVTAYTSGSISVEATAVS